jgi:uncharacterized protein YjiK
MKIMAKIGILAIGIALVLVFRNDIGNLFASGNKKVDQKKEKNKEAAIPSEEINVIKSWELPSSLREISGISFIDNDRVACIQDEAGTIYIFRLSSGKIEKEIAFAGSGDYEDVVVIGSTAFVMRADGLLIEVKNFESQNKSVVEHKTFLTAENNVEGLTYDEKNKRLLMSIKDEDKFSPGNKGIYSFNLDKRQLDTEPVAKIDMESGLLEKGKKKGASLKPSAIAVHPSTGKYYLTDGPKSKLVILSGGDIENVFQLDEKKFPQPEGLSFSPDGKLYISSEGGKGAGVISLVEIKQ